MPVHVRIAYQTGLDGPVRVGSAYSPAPAHKHRCHNLWHYVFCRLVKPAQSDRHESLLHEEPDKLDLDIEEAGRSDAPGLP